MKKKFAFLIHPREIDDLYRRLGNVLGIGEKTGMKYLPKFFPKSISEFALKYLRGRAGFTVCSHFDVMGKAEGYIIAVLLTGRQIVNLPRHFVNHGGPPDPDLQREYTGRRALRLNRGSRETRLRVPLFSITLGR